MIIYGLLLRNYQSKCLLLDSDPLSEPRQNALCPLNLLFPRNYGLCLRPLVTRLLILQQFFAGFVLQLHIRYPAFNFVNLSEIESIVPFPQLTILSLQLGNRFLLLPNLLLQILLDFKALLVAILNQSIAIKCMHLHQLLCLLILLVIGAATRPSRIQHLSIHFLCSHLARKLSMLYHLLFLTIVIGLHDGDEAMVSAEMGSCFILLHVANGLVCLVS